MIQLINITHFFGEQQLYSNLNWAINMGSKVGLVGNNGSGKTTLLKILMGLIEPKEGNITFPRNSRIGYLPQDLVEIENIPLLNYLKKQAGIDSLEKELRIIEENVAQTAQNQGEGYKTLLKRHDLLVHQYEQLGGYEFTAMAQKVLKGLGFAEEDGQRYTGEFSGGWKMRISLAAILLSSPNVLLLDEPTNHLDTESMEWLEDWLSHFSGTLITISHDRHFLDKICSSIAELSHENITVYKGNFTWYLEEKARREEELERIARKQRSEIEKEMAFIERFRYKATKATQVQSRIKRLEKMNIVEIDDSQKVIGIHFPQSPRSGHEVLSVKDVQKDYGNHTVFQHISFTVHRGEKIALVGVNGAGKSTLSRLISLSEQPTYGEVSLGYNVKMGFFSQESAKNLTYSRTIWEEISHTGYLGTDMEKRSLLGAFLFSGDDIYKSISVLSGGEKSRVALLKLLLEETNLLILDEPTNHLDMQTRDVFQQALTEYGGTVIIVSHDRYFLDNLVTRVIEIRDGEIFDYPGNYSYFIEKRAERLNQQKDIEASKEKENVSSKNDEKERKRKEAEQRNLLYREKQKIMKHLSPLEEKIEKTEEEKQEIESMLCDPTFLENSQEVQKIMVRYNEINALLSQYMKEWESLMEQIDFVEKEVMQETSS
ncbi:MAG: ATP-binding cassette domain-containing protein [Aminobacterium sp.]|jgi:ATP-binding cassette subfamily F protein 3|uniref:ABC transporter ATP-binding protein n=1 Tax=unclassified Aminobacterium TaxID=2685012 RepID=UPI001BD0FA75|nr:MULTISPECIES: ATP-binding cassette domain-containing protein [unclassified Aminobacterium]MDD2206423.1 ATP-binding cassette domain-containing protein [Aminobacterium sp.]MDD3426544.1 ATP-binding cassette domain-containing protein [Aminobacterium sp.]MDD3707738.1 ATP-binding cassette domain-containing protein [Aminobacterium sp.]MDD4228242.1 ATP-binding cassette domain-containing protein [Aminobacterium sp.]MDD4551279.1 ATP-binding cassette domain-containing protein [Aminobacterium sp.]